MNSEISIGDLVSLILKIMSTKASIKSSEVRIRPERSEVERLICDNSKILKHTGWEPDYSLEKGLTEVIKWMKDSENLSRYKSEIYNV